MGIRRKLFVTIGAFSFALPAFGQVPANSSQAATPRSAEPKSADKPASKDSHEKEPYVMEFIRTKVRFEPDGRGNREVAIRAKIQSEAGVRDFGVLIYPFASSFETLDILYARVHKPDGTVVETPPSDAQELDSAVSREAPMYTDQREKHLAVKSLSSGDVLEASVRYTIHDPVAPGHFWYDDSFFKASTCLREILELDVPKDIPVKLRYSGAKPAEQDNGTRRIFTFESSYTKPASDSKIPDWEKNFRGLTPPDIQLTSFASWSEVGAWFGQLVGPKVSQTPEIRSKAEELTKGKTTNEEKAKAIYDFVSTRFRYIGIDLGESRYRPHAAADVLTNRYGDCKDKHVLFAALLQAAGIPASPVLLSSSFRIDPEFPSPSLFDHVISAIPHSDGESFLFLDTTPEIAPYGMLLPQLRDRQVLVVSENGTSRLVKTPLNSEVPNYQVFRIDSSIDTKGTLDAKMTLETRGVNEIALRAAYRATPQNRWEELTQNIMYRLGFAGTVSEVTVGAPEDTSKPFTIAFSYHRPDFPDWKSQRITFPSPPLGLPELNDAQKSSKDPLPLGPVEEITFTSSVKFPAGYTPVLPEKVERKTGFAEFSAIYSVEKGVLTGTLHYKSLTNEVPGEQRSAYVSLAKLMEDTQRKYVFVNGNFPNVAAALAAVAGDPEKQIPILEERLKEDPDNDYLLRALNRAYLKTGRAKDAVDVLQKNIDSHPNDVPPHLYIDLGLSYLRIPEPDKAMAAFEKVLDEEAEPNDLNSAAYGLAEANTHLAEAQEFSNRAVKALSEKTMQISPEDAGAREFGLMLELAASWDTLGWIKFRSGDYSGAQKYLAASWDVVQSATIGEHLVEAYEKVGDKKDAAEICNMAIDTALPGDTAEIKEKLNKEMATLRSFVPRSSPFPGDSHNSPKYVQGAVALSDLRMRNVPYQVKLSGQSASAQFLISLVNGPKVEAVVFLSGSEELHAAKDAISKVKFPHVLPDATPARILRKATLTCTVYSKICTLILMPATEAPGSFRQFPVNFQVPGD